jgi:hypothetical protein
VRLVVRFKVSASVWVRPPPVAVRVSAAAPVFAVEPRVSVKVLLPLPGAATLCGLKLAVTPAGKPETESVTAELKPGNACVVRMVLPLPPEATDRAPVLAVRVKPGTLAVIAVVFVSPTPLAPIVSGYAPPATFEVAARVNLVVPEPGAAIVAGENCAVIPLGIPVT